jgi:SAM-dependent methyltransferase
VSDARGLLFDRVAEEYDRARRGYPAELVDASCARAGLSAGSRVLEVGCGTGKLTVALVERGLRVDAVDPGESLLRVARERVGTAPVRFHHGSFEDVELAGGYEALFSATAFHWVDPQVGWAKAARLLRPGGLLALVTHVAGEPLPVDIALRAAWRETAGDARALSARREDELWAGAEARRGNVSALWRWLERRDDFDAAAAQLFEDVQLDKVRIELDESAEELIALTRTQSSYIQLDEERRRLLEERIAEAVANAGGRYRSSIFALLVTARRPHRGSKLST